MVVRAAAAAPSNPAIFLSIIAITQNLEQMPELARCFGVSVLSATPIMEVKMPVLLWLLGVPVIVIIGLMLTHVI
jgi:hypothetical protein